MSSLHRTERGRRRSSIPCAALCCRDEGTISFSDGMDEQGFDVILSGERNLYVKNTVYENLIYFSMLKGMSKSTADAAIDREKEKFPIYETVKNKLVETLS